MRIAIQMDPIETINVASDTTYVLALEAQQRGFDIFYYTPNQLRYENQQLIVACTSLTLHHNHTPFFTLGSTIECPVTEFDIVLVRQDPPFDMHYQTYCHLLETVYPKPLVINHPAALRNCPEKLFVLQFPELTPPTLIGRERSAVQRFLDFHETIVVKPLYAHGGKDVFHLKKGDKNFDTIIELMREKYREPFIAQKFIPEITQGDKRIILIDGEPIGAINRIPESDSIRSNLVRGGTAEKTELTARDQEICKTIAPALKENAIMLAGIDVIGDYLTEINITSPTGLQAINQLYGIRSEALFWDAVIANSTRSVAH